MRKPPTVLAALLILAVAAVATATAANPPTSTQMLKFFTGGAGTIVWTSAGGSSSADDNQALELRGTTQGTDYSGAYAIDATSSGVLLSQFNGSFDVKGYEGAGSPRISLPVDTDGDGTTDMWAYLSALYATGDARSAVGATGFDHVDFQAPGATIYTSSATVLNGLSDPLNATGSIAYRWGGFTFDVNDADARAGWKVATDEQPFLILDEAPAVSYVDNLTIGSFNWQRPGKPGFVDDLAPADNAQSDGGTMHWSNNGDSFDVVVDDVIIGGGVVAFSGLMANGQGQWAAYDGRVIQEYLDTNTNDLYGLIGGTNEAPTSTTGFDGPFPFTGVVTVS